MPSALTLLYPHSAHTHFANLNSSSTGCLWLKHTGVSTRMSLSLQFLLTGIPSYFFPLTLYVLMALFASLLQLSIFILASYPTFLSWPLIFPLTITAWPSLWFFKVLSLNSSLTWYMAKLPLDSIFFSGPLQRHFLLMEPSYFIPCMGMFPIGWGHLLFVSSFLVCGWPVPQIRFFSEQYKQSIS